MKLLKTLLLGLIIILLNGCVQTKFTSLEKNDKEDNLEVFFTNRPNRKYKEIEIIETVTFNIFHQKKAVLKKMKQKARIRGADALIITDFGYVTILFLTLHKGQGVLIKYDD